MDKKLYDFILNKSHHQYRKEVEIKFDNSMTPVERMTYRFEKMCESETPVILENEQICYIRTIKNIPDIFTQSEWDDIKSKYHIHELGYLSNLSPNYEDVIKSGLLAKYEMADEYGKRCIDAIINLSDRYKAEAEKQGRYDISKTLPVELAEPNLRFLSDKFII